MSHIANIQRDGISVIIPTYNKFNRLELVLKTLLKQNVSEINAEIIIVDQSNINAERLLKNIPNSKEGIVIRYFKQKGAGISRAKNFGLTNANYKLAVFIDDDITPTFKSWLLDIWKLYQKYKFTIACGPILLTHPLPRHLRVYKSLYAHFYRGGKPKYLPIGSFVPGAQLIIEKAFIISIGGFRKNLGRIKNSLLSGEDDELSYTFGKFRKKVFYSPKLKVDHHISTHRLNLRYLYKRLFWQGVTDLLLLRYENKFMNKVFIATFLSWARVSKKLIKTKFLNKKPNRKYISEWYYNSGKIWSYFRYIFLPKVQERPIDIYTQI